MVELVLGVTKENWEASHARHFAIAGNRSSALSRKKNAKGCIREVFRDGVHVGYQARFGVDSRKSSSKEFSLDEDLARVRVWLADRVRERAEELAATEPESDPGPPAASKKRKAAFAV